MGNAERDQMDSKELDDIFSVTSKFTKIPFSGHKLFMTLGHKKLKKKKSGMSKCFVSTFSKQTISKCSFKSTFKKHCLTQNICFFISARKKNKQKIIQFLFKTNPIFFVGGDFSVWPPK